MPRESIFLTQTDTTIGFVSQSIERLNSAKNRPSSKHYIRAINSLQTLKNFTRVPAMHKKRVRRSNFTTFVMPNRDSYRVIVDKHHLLLLDRLRWAYTTSANLSGEAYNESFARSGADIVVEPLSGLSRASAILKLGKKQIKRIR